VLIPAPYLPAVFSLTAVGVWGASDFLGGVGARRANAFLFTSIVHLSGMVLAGALALAIGLPFPTGGGLGWALIAGAVGGAALALFYRALASGKMGLVAPVAAVLSAAIPTVVTAFSEGFPGARHLLGFVLAGIGVWLISRTEKGTHGNDGNNGGGDEGHPKGLGMAVLAGCGFAGFYLCIHRAGDGSALWIAVCSRFASFVVTLVFVCLGRQFRAVSRPVLAIAVIAGILDITGSVVFVRASQIGRLDVAVVLSSLYPAVTVILARIFLHEHFSRARTVGMLAALAAVPMIAG
jgi:drug/metabolite transporter (DMT)-like permease